MSCTPRVSFPCWVPVGVLLMEPAGRRLVPFVILGAVTAGYLFWVGAAHAISYHEQGHCIVYETSGRFLGVVAVAYVVATCGAALVSGYRWMVVFGVANLVGLAGTLLVRACVLTSLWCLYAAVTSVFILLVLVRRRRNPSAGSVAWSARRRVRATT